MALTILGGLGVVALCVWALRIAKPEHYSPKCCVGLAVSIIRENEQKEKAARAAQNTCAACAAPVAESGDATKSA